MNTPTSAGTLNRKNTNVSASTSASCATENRALNNSIQYTNCKWDLKSVNIDTTGKKQKFQTDPGLYGVLFGTRKNETNESMISFAYIDCSILAVEGGLLTGRSQEVYGLLFELTVSVAKPFFKKEEIEDQEVLILDFKR
jgi:hypothetical protein